MNKENDATRVLTLLKKYGYHSQSYNILRSDKSYFYSPSGIDGVIAYVVRVNVAMAAGDPVCRSSDISDFVAEFELYCNDQKWRCCFQSITDRSKDILEKMGFGLIKIGEEPIIDLDKFSLAGSAFSG